MLTDQLLQEIITCPKTVIKADRRKMILDNRHYKNNVYLVSNNGIYKYKIFMRKSDEFIEDFSIGLIWTNANECINLSKNIILLRCQGPHDGKKPLETDIHHSYHTHEITVDDITNKRYLKPSNRNLSKDFSSFEEAALYVTRKCGIIDLDKFIDTPSPYSQISFLE